MIPMTQEQLAFMAQMLRVMSEEACTNSKGRIEGKFALGLEWKDNEYILRYTKLDESATRGIDEEPTPRTRTRRPY